MDAIVTAGGTPAPEDLLYPYTQGAPKALLDMAGKPMIQWVLDALSQSSLVEHVVVIGLTADSGVTCSKALDFIPDQGGMLDNIRAGARRLLEMNPAAQHALVVASDIPSITGESVDWVVNEVLKSDADIHYNVITRQVMEARFPGSRRSYTKLKDAEVCGGDLNAIRCAMALDTHSIWDEIIATRKNVLKQAALIGYDTLLLLLLRAITIEQAVGRVTKRLNLTAKALICPYAELGMDVDKPNQLEMLRADLSKRQAGAAQAA